MNHSKVLVLRRRFSYITSALLLLAGLFGGANVRASAQTFPAATLAMQEHSMST